MIIARAANHRAWGDVIADLRIPHRAICIAKICQGTVEVTMRKGDVSVVVEFLVIYIFEQYLS